MNDVHKSHETTLQETTISSVHFTAFHDALTHLPPPDRLHIVHSLLTHRLLGFLNIILYYIQIVYEQKLSNIKHQISKRHRFI